ncbi:MAG: response regulator [Brevundimonas sp.]
MIKPTVLIVDDEPLISLMVAVVFEEAGFEVITVANAAEAEQISHKNENLAAIVTDIQLGKGPNGWAVAVDARTRLPRIPIVYVTGDSASDWAAFGVPRSVLVQKPFVAAQVLAAVMKLMNEDNISVSAD